MPMFSRWSNVILQQRAYNTVLILDHIPNILVHILLLHLGQDEPHVSLLHHLPPDGGHVQLGGGILPPHAPDLRSEVVIEQGSDEEIHVGHHHTSNILQGFNMIPFDLNLGVHFDQAGSPF